MMGVGSKISGLSAKALLPHPRYHFHGFAPDIILGDSKFFDRSGPENHGVRGANLSEANMLANAGYVSTIDPVGGAADSVLRLPNLNFDYNGGEKLILWWLGKITPEGSSVEFIGDGGFSTSYPGVSVRATSTGKAQLKFSDATSTYFSGTTTSTAFDGNLHSLGVVVDGAAKKGGVWVDDVLDALNPSGPITLNGGNPMDTRNANTFNVGTNLPAISGSTVGVATQTRALHLLRLSAADPMPHHTAVSSVFRQLRANPGRAILGWAF